MELQKYKEPFMVTTVQDIIDYCSLFEWTEHIINQVFFLGKDIISVSNNLTGPWTITVNDYSWSEIFHSYKHLTQSIQNVLDGRNKNC